MDLAIEAKLLRLLGLGVRGRGAVVGVERVREAASRGTLVLAIVAPDASDHSQHKVRPLLAAKRIPVIDGPSAAVLGSAVGREATATVGVTDAALARGIQQVLGLAVGGPGGAPERGRDGRTSARGAVGRGRIRRTD